MTELELYKFITNNEIEIDWRGSQLLAWIEHYYLEEFSDMLDRCDADDGGIKCRLQNGGVVVLDLSEVCEEYDIDPNNISESDEG